MNFKKKRNSRVFFKSASQQEGPGFKSNSQPGPLDLIPPTIQRHGCFGVIGNPKLAIGLKQISPTSVTCSYLRVLTKTV